MNCIENTKALKEKIVAFTTEALEKFTQHHPDVMLEAIGLNLDAYAGMVNISVAKTDYYKESIADYIKLETTAAIHTPETIAQLKAYLEEGYEYHLKDESFRVLDRFKKSMGDWTYVAIESVQLFTDPELDNLRTKENTDGTNYMTEIKQLCSEAFLEYLQSKAFTKVNKKDQFVFLVQDVNDSIEDAILKFNKVRRANLRFIKNDVLLKQRIVDWVTEKMKMLAAKYPPAKFYAIAFDMDTYEAMTYLSINTKKNCEEEVAKIAGTSSGDYYGEGNFKYVTGNYKYCAFEEIYLYKNNPSEFDAVKAIPVIEGNWFWSEDLRQIFAEALLDYERTDEYKNLNLEPDAFVFGSNADENVKDSIAKFNAIKSAYLD